MNRRRTMLAVLLARAVAAPVFCASVSSTSLSSRRPDLPSLFIVGDSTARLGQDKVQVFFPKDRTHTIAAGAKFNAQCVADGLKAIGKCPLAE